jgi:hypothetical protein
LFILQELHSGVQNAFIAFGSPSTSSGTAVLYL